MAENVKAIRKRNKEEEEEEECWMDDIYILKKNISSYMKLYREAGECFNESLLRGKGVLNLQRL